MQNFNVKFPSKMNHGIECYDDILFFQALSWICGINIFILERSLDEDSTFNSFQNFQFLDVRSDKLLQ